MKYITLLILIFTLSIGQAQSKKHPFEIAIGLVSPKATPPEGYSPNKAKASLFSDIPISASITWHRKAPHGFQFSYHHLFYSYEHNLFGNNVVLFRDANQFSLTYHRILLNNPAKSLFLTSSIGPTYRSSIWETTIWYSTIETTSTHAQINEAFGLQAGFSGKFIFRERISITSELLVDWFMNSELSTNFTTGLNVGYFFG